MQQTGRRYQAAGILFLFLFLTLMLPGLPGFTYDVNCWRGWSTHILKHGLSQAYTSDTNYPPFYQYILWAFGRLAGSEQAIAANIAYIRCFTLVFELWGLLLVWKWAKPRVDFLALAVICMLNIAYSYNTMVWGQMDAIVATLTFAAIYTAHRKRLLWSGCLMVLALNMKLQAIVFLPLWGLLVLEAVIRNRPWREISKVAGAVILTQFLLLIPFLGHGTAGLKPIWKVVTTAAGFFPRLSMNAYNLWFWVARKPIAVLDTVKPFWGIKYKSLGLMLFMALSFLALLPVLLQLCRTWRNKVEMPVSKERIWLTAALVSLLFFFCNTEMHERYAHPAFIFLTAYAFSGRNFLPWVLFSLAYFLNMEGVLHWLKWPPYGSFIFDGRFVAALNAGLIIYLFALVYRKEKTSGIPDLIYTP